MSLRKSPRRTPRLLAAARQNGRRSAGPRSAAAKQNSKLNALKHGERAQPENHRQVMLALGEDPAEFDNLKRELMTTYGPRDALWERQIDDLARLYWRRERLERAQEGVMRRALLEVEEQQHSRRQEIAGATFAASQAEMLDLGVLVPAAPDVRLRKLLSFLEVIRAQVKQRTFKPRQHSVLESLYQGSADWRQARLRSLLALFSESVRVRTKQDEELEEWLNQRHGPGEAAGEAQHEELLRLLEEEIAHVREEFEHAEKMNEERVAIERDAALAPVGEEWAMMLRREAALDRSIDRKVRILLSLRKEFLAGNLPGTAADGDNDPDTRRAKETVECRGVRHSPEKLAPSLPTGGSPPSCGPTQAPTDVGMARRGEARFDFAHALTSLGVPEQGRRDRPELLEGSPRPYKVATAHSGLKAADENTKLNERTANVFENKAMLWKTAATGANLLEDKGDPCTIRECR